MKTRRRLASIFANRFLLLLALTGALKPVARAQETGVVLTKIARWPGWTRFGISDIAVKGDLAFCGGNGLQIYNIRDPDKAVHLAQLERMGFVASICIKDNLAYLAASGSGLWIVNVGNPYAPEQIGALELEGAAVRVEVFGECAYVAAGSGGLHIVDVSEPRLPRKIGTYRPVDIATNFVWDVQVNGATAYVLCGRRIEIIDLSQPAVPIKRLSLTNVAWGLALEGNCLLLSDLKSLSVFDVSTPWVPVLRGRAAVTNASPIAAHGDLAFVGCHNDGLVTVDISNPGNPLPLGAARGFYASRVRVAGNRAFCLAGVNGATVFDVTNPGTPIQTGTFGRGQYTSEVEIAGSLAYISDWPEGPRVLDLTASAQPLLLGTWNLSAPSILQVDGKLAFLTSGAKLQILDLTNPIEPQELGAFTTTNGIDAMKVAGDRVYLVDAGMRLYVLDVGSPTHPVNRGTYSGMSAPFDVHGNWLYSRSGVYDVTDPTKVRRVHYLPVSDYVAGLRVSGSLALALEDRYGDQGTIVMRVLGLGDPSAPTVLATYPMAETGLQVEMQGGMAFIRTRTGIEVVSLADPGRPEFLERLNLNDMAEDMAIAGSVLCVATAYSGVNILRISASQTITFAPMTDQVFPGPPVLLRATASSGMPVTFRIVSGPALLSNRQLTLIGAGSVTVRADQAGGFGHLPATAETSFLVKPAAFSGGVPWLFGHVEYGQFVLVWPAAAPGFVLESSNPLEPSAWVEAGLTPIRNGDFMRAAVPTIGANRFFRLRQ